MPREDVIPELVDVDRLVFIESGSWKSTSSNVDRGATRALVVPHLRGSEVTIRMGHEDRTSGCWRWSSARSGVHMQGEAERLEDAGKTRTYAS